MPTEREALLRLRDVVRYFWDDDNARIGELDSACALADDALAAQAAPVPSADAVDPKWLKAVQEAYGWLWHVNTEPMAPVPMWSPGQAAYEARKNLLGLLTTEQRGEAINAVSGLLRNKADAVQKKTIAQSAQDGAPITHCQCNRDGDCVHAQCPQLRDSEPARTGRSCPLLPWD